MDNITSISLKESKLSRVSRVESTRYHQNGSAEFFFAPTRGRQERSTNHGSNTSPPTTTVASKPLWNVIVTMNRPLLHG
jgi:hypothetical protein